MRINVKTYRMTFADGGTDSQRERAWNEASEAWWNTAADIARELGIDIYQDGRMGGWLVADDVDPDSDLANTLEARIGEHLKQGPAYFATSLASIMAEDDAQALQERRETATILAALRFWQTQPNVTPELHAIATDGDQVNPLTNEEIDTLCERING